LGALEALHDRYADRVAFLVVYIREAHPEDGWVLSANRSEGIALADPRSADERGFTAETCAVRLHVRLPVLIDEIDDEVARRYGGWPDRLYLIDSEGRVAFQGEKGPSGFRPDELERAIETELERVGAGAH
jgi:hypothetical protein